MFDIKVEYGEKNSPLYDWRPNTTYIRRPPYWKGALAAERTMKGMRPLAVLGDNITNYSAKETRRVDLVVGVSYTDDLQKVEKVLQDILSKDERVLGDPPPTIAVSELADSSVNFVVRPWVKTGDYWSVYFDLTKNIKLRFDAEGIAIPFPQRDIHLFQEKV